MLQCTLIMLVLCTVMHRIAITHGGFGMVAGGFVGAPPNANASASWEATSHNLWNLLDQGSPSNAVLPPPTLKRCGVLPMRDGWTVEGKGFGLVLVGTVSVPEDSLTAQFSFTTKLQTGESDWCCHWMATSHPRRSDLVFCV